MKLAGAVILTLRIESKLQPAYLEPPRFDPLYDADEAREHFKLHGFAVFRAARSTELEQAWEFFWEYVEGLGTGVSRDDPRTWTADRWPSPQFGTGIMPFFGVGQSAFMWYLRGLPRVRAAFAALWGTEQLLVSFDGVVIYRGQALTETDQYWWHVDQNPRSLPDFDCVQGLLQLTPTSPAVGGFVVIPGSHSLYPQFYEDRYGKLLDTIQPEMHYFSIPSWDPEAQAHFGPMAVQPHLEAGDLIIWNSSSLHCSIIGGGFSSLDSNWSSGALGRVAALIAMTPSEKATPEVLRRRKAAICKGITTTHWPHRFVDAKEHNEDNWASLGEAYTQRFVPPQPPILNALQLRLVGYTDLELASIGVGVDAVMLCDESSIA